MLGDRGEAGMLAGMGGDRCEAEAGILEGDETGVCEIKFS